MNLLKEEKGQTSIEIIILLGAVIVVVTFVMLGIKNNIVNEGGQRIADVINDS
ncbi:MAG: class III signal peptide-containing protein [archaeon]|nr:class III signal peptide-containing protein [archaeon]